jgi:phosphoribosylaminoimidazole carboxylase PurK protein
MLTQAAVPLGFEVTVLDPAERGPAVQAGANLIRGGLTEPEAISRLVESTDVTTWEIEHIDTETLAYLEATGRDIQPHAHTLRIIQDKLHQKLFLKSWEVPVAPHIALHQYSDYEKAFDLFDGDVIIKTRRGGYDGRGNLAPEAEGSIQAFRRATEAFGDRPLYAEQIIPFKKELAVMVARDKLGELASYPVVETVHRDNICHMVLAPAPVSLETRNRAEEVARQAIAQFNGAGIFGVELFLTADDEVLVNEIAPRVHNSGHHTIEANHTSQFEQHIRAVTGLPLGSTEMVTPAAVMVNILGDRNGDYDLRGLNDVLELPDTHVHLYGKRPTAKARKMGHITVRAGDLDEAKERALFARSLLSV